MKVLIIGDIVGNPGRGAVKRFIADFDALDKFELIIANGENAAGGSGITASITNELLSSGVDVITTGDHIWKRKEVIDIIDIESKLLRPANYPAGVPGRGSIITTTRGGIKVGVLNLLGRVFMAPLDCPFKVARKEIERIKKITNVVIVDIHAEATSEKIALGWYLDGLVSAVVGTHTHVQTADQRVLPNGTAYISDIGMTGPIDSVLGRRREDVLQRFVSCMPVRFEIASENIQVQGVIVDIDPKTGRATSIERVQKKL